MLYLDPKAKLPQTQKKKTSYLVGFGHNVGNHLTFETLEEDMRTVPHRNVISADDPGHRNKRLHFKPRKKRDMEVDVEEAEAVSYTHLTLPTIYSV